MRVNGSETHINRAETMRSKGGFDTLSPFNYIMDDFTDSNFFYHWQMVDTVKEVLSSFEKLDFKRKLQVNEPTIQMLKLWKNTKRAS